MNKKLVSVGISLAMIANSIPGNLVESFAEEVVNTQVEEVIEIQEAIGEENQIINDVEEEQSQEEKQQTRISEMTRTATVNVKVENNQYGQIEGLDENNQVVVKSQFTNIKENTDWKKTTTYEGNLVSSDDAKTIVVTPKSGYEFDKTSLLALKATDKITDCLSVEQDGDIVKITVSSLKDEKWTKSVLIDNTNRVIPVEVKFSKKSDAKTLTTTVEGQGEVTLENSENIVNENGTYTIVNENNYTFKVTPAEGMEVKSVTLDENLLEVVDGKVGVKGSDVNADSKLNVVFGEPVEITYDLDVTVKGNGNAIIAGQKVGTNETSTLKLNKGENYTLSFNPEKDYYVSLVKLDGIEINDYKLENIDDNHTLEVVFSEKIETRVEYSSDLTIQYDGNEKTLSYKIVGNDDEILKEGNVEFKKVITLPFVGDVETPIKPKDTGNYDFTIEYSGDDTHKGVSVSETFEITKCNPKVYVGNKKVEYNGKAVSVPVTVTPECGYITIYTGVNVKLSPNIYVDLNLGNGTTAQIIKQLLGNAKLGTVGDLVEFFKNNQGIFETAGIDISQIIKVLEIIPSDVGLSFGSPNQPGAYMATAVVLDSNANIAVGVGSLLIVRQNKKVVFTEDSLEDKAYVKHGSEYKHEAYYEGTTSPAKIMYSGVTLEGKSYFSERRPTELGTYVAVAYSYDDLGYKAALATRTFVIGKYLTNIEITSENKTYDGKGYEPTSIVRDRHGNIVENASAEYTYYKGLTKLESAPKDAGIYTVVAKYNCTDEYFVSMTSKIIKINKADITVTANDAEKYENKVDPEFTYNINGLCARDTLNVKFIREEGELVGEYRIMPLVEQNSNYNLTIVDGKLTIKAMTYKVNVSVKDKVYDGKSIDVKAEIIDSLNEKIENPQVTYKYYKKNERGAIQDSPVNPGEYEVVAEYKGFTASANFEIKKAQATIKINDVNKVEGQVDPEFTYSVDGLIGTDSLEVTLTREEGEIAGEYLISATCKENPNYDVTVKAGKLIISEKVVPSQPEDSTDEKPKDEQKPVQVGQSVDKTEQKPGQSEESESELEEDVTQLQQPNDTIIEEQKQDQSQHSTSTSVEYESVKTFDKGIAGYLSMGLFALGGLFISRRKRD